MVGADYATGPLVAGLSLSHSRGPGRVRRFVGTPTVGVEAERRESPLQGGTDHAALARATVGW